MNVNKAILHGSWDGWSPLRLDDTGKTTSTSDRPNHGGQVLVAYFVGKSGPFVDSDRFEGGEWDMRRKNPGCTVYAWREHLKAPQANVVGL